MPFVTLACPQCSAPLPRQASWRIVTCPFCHATVTKSAQTVQAAWFHEAYLRAHAPTDPDSAGRTVHCMGKRFAVLEQLGSGGTSTVMLAQRLGPLPERVTIKLVHSGGSLDAAQQELEILQRLQAIVGTGAAYFTRRLPQPIGVGKCGLDISTTSSALLQRSPTGYWGALADVKLRQPSGIDARHGVWLWRRVLEVLAFVHDHGWAHGRIAPEHLLVKPRDHGVKIIGWCAAQQHGKLNANAAAADLQQSAASVLALISATHASEVSDLLRRAASDPAFCAQHGARGLDAALKTAALSAFGTPRFEDFNPN